nr:hypothetical protein [Tanacetum cinerariifolium]
MSSDSHATITYTSMSSYEVIVNGYYWIPMDPYVQLVMEAPPLPDYIPGPESEEDSTEYPTSGGDDDVDDDGNDLSDDDVDDEDEEESLDKPFEEGETAATPPPFGYPRVFLRRTYRFGRELALLLPLVDMRWARVLLLLLLDRLGLL